MRSLLYRGLKLILLCLLALGLPKNLFAKTETLKIDFQPAELSFEKTLGFDKIRFRGGEFVSPLGNPAIPAKFIQIAVPQDLDIEKVLIISEKHHSIPGEYKIYPTQPQLPLSKIDQKVKFIEPNPLVYSSNKEYPGKLAEIVSDGFLAGQHIAGIALYPLQYIPSKGELILYTEMELRLVYRKSDKKPLPFSVRTEKGAKIYSDQLKSMVINPEEIQVKSIPSSQLTDTIEYLIITPLQFASAFQPLADWKSKKGIKAEVIDVAWVLANFSGNDDQEKIRNFIRYAYQNYGTIWVLLGGDTQYIPCRFTYIFDADLDGRDWRDNIPTDLYYSDLDGNWNFDGDTTFGEYSDSVDLYSDVFVGRASVSTFSQAQAVVDKTLQYETDPPSDYITKALFVGTVLWSDPYTDGGELKTFIDDYYLPSIFDVTKLYESLGNLNKSSFRIAFNSGKNILNHYGHGSVSGFSIGPDYWYTYDMDALTNSPRFSVLYTISCLSNAFDQDCLGEHALYRANGGCVAYFGNSRYGWGMPGEPTAGSGPELDIQFFNALSNLKIYHSAQTLSEAKAVFVPIARNAINPNGKYMRWALFAMNLLGDPELGIWTDSLSDFTVSHPRRLKIGSHSINVSVTHSGSALSEASLCLSRNPEIYQIATTDSLGKASFSFEALDTCHILLVATNQNFIPYQGTIQIVNYYPGDVNGDSTINLSDCISLANYVLKGKTPPDPIESGDTNCDTEINLADVILLANYILKGGPGPCSF
jgi:hypothetical protein